MEREAFLVRLRERRWSRPAPPIPDPPAPGFALELDRFGTELAAVGGVLHRDPATVVEVARALKARSFVAGPTPAARRAAHRLAAAGLEEVHAPDQPHRVAAALSTVALAVVEADFAIAESGTIGLWSGAGRSRLLSALPPALLVLLDPALLLSRLEEVPARLKQLGAMPSSVALVTGVSCTGDVDQRMVVGVQGPMALHVVVEA